MNDIIVVSGQSSVEDMHIKKKYAKAIKWTLVALGSITASILVYKNREIIGNRLKQFLGEHNAEFPVIPQATEAAEQVESSEIIESITTKTIEVSSHCRRLPEGCHASAGKLQQAAEMGIDLFEEYTLVDEYTYERIV